MLRERHVRGPVGRQHQQPHLVETAGQIVQHVDRRDIRPMQVVEKQDERAQPRHFEEERAELPFHPLLRHRRRVLAHARHRRLAGFGVATCTYQVGATVLMSEGTEPDDDWCSRLSRASSTGR